MSESVTLERPPAPPSPPGRKAKRPMKRSLKIAAGVIALVSLLEAAAFAGTYVFHSSRYVSVDNAQVDGDKININAPMTGTLTDWTATPGSSVGRNDIVGRVRGIGAGQPKRPIKSPGEGTIAVSDAVEGQYVTEGTTLATAFDPDTVHVTARVPEDEIRDVRVGQRVDISIDAYPDAKVVGVVSEVQAAAAGEFSFFPSPDSDPTNPQKIDQYIPVEIQILDVDGVTLLPGLNVVADIHKD